jgi:hypothetical protein
MRGDVAGSRQSERRRHHESRGWGSEPLEKLEEIHSMQLSGILGKLAISNLDRDHMKCREPVINVLNGQCLRGPMEKSDGVPILDIFRLSYTNDT